MNLFVAAKFSDKIDPRSGLVIPEFRTELTAIPMLEEAIRTVCRDKKRAEAGKKSLTSRILAFV
jgi:hypothetical protein